MTDAEWAVVRQGFPTPAWMESRGGRPEGYCHRQTLDAIRYLVDNGIKWRSMPADFPPFLWNMSESSPRAYRWGCHKAIAR
ncbi:transposase [Streptomyces atratus]|uniref:transposase n=1 Tax=Streptomyces atratus TaxID=1893 RepID=UPI003F540A35